MKAFSRPVLLGAAAVLSWSTVATAFKVALSHMDPFEMVFVASATALAVFTVWMCATRSWGELKGLRPAVWLRFAALGLIAPVAYYLVLFKAYDFLPAQVAQPINYSWPILLAVMLAIFTRRPIPAAKYLGMGVSLAGVAVISLGGSGIGGAVSPVGVGLAALSALLWAAYWIVNDSLKDALSEGAALFLTFLFGMAYMVIGAAFHPLPAFSAPALLSGAYIGLFEMGIPFICFGLAIRSTDNPALINQMCYLSPFLSLFFISVVLGETIVPATYIGLSLIVGGLVYNQYFAPKSAPAH
ncbi:MAG: DMT family transporter [Clostridium sp.]|nr:DMT family transporter [Clostridium sp.]